MFNVIVNLLFKLSIWVINPIDIRFVTNETLFYYFLFKNNEFNHILCKW